MIKFWPLSGTILGITNACGAVPGFVANQVKIMLLSTRS